MCLLGFLLSVFGVLVAIANGGGEYELRMLNFLNGNGTTSEGRCCDLVLLLCTVTCDHRFRICVDNADGGDNPMECAFGYAMIPTIENQNNIVFGRTIGDIENVFRFQFESKPAGAKVKIVVTDDDSLHDDHVATLIQRIPADVEDYQQFTVGQNDKSLSFVIKVSCHADYYGNCTTHCLIDPARSQHVMCDPDTGAEICRPGWRGDDCNTRQCPPGYTGVDCQTAEVCSPNPCQNGGQCIPDGLNYSCDCSSATGFAGLMCETAI